MKRVIIYLVVLLIVFCALGIAIINGVISIRSPQLQVASYSGIIGAIGGIVYCLRGVYLNACVLKQWDNIWLPWYFIRPIVSGICGVVSYLFLKAGLIVLEAQPDENPSNLAYYALAFAAGLNVDKFVEKIEDISQVTWGIKKSRAAKISENSDGDHKDS